MTVLVNKDLEGSGRGLINHVPGGLNNARWKHVVLRLPNETRTRNLPHRGPRRLTRLFVHCSRSGKTDFHKPTSKTDRNKQRKQRMREKRQANPTVKEFSYDSAALHKHWKETRNHEIKYVASDLFHR